MLPASQIDNTMIGERMLAILAGFFSVVALLFVGVGLYGVINYATVRRTREIGIRIAHGARRAAVLPPAFRAASADPLLALRHE